MDIFLYIVIFIIGTLFGSFFTLAVYRIPLKKDITHERSYCPNCNHKLSFLDMIPIFSYLFLGGKCRYCKQKIKIRYLILEVLTGIIFLLFAMSLKICFYPLEISKLVYLLFAFLYLAGLIIIGGIDKEKHKIYKSLLLYEIVVLSIYMIYLYTVEKANIYRYVIYLFYIILFLIFENIYYKKKLKNCYPFEVLELCMIIVIFSYEISFILAVIFTLLIIAFKNIIKKIKESKNKIAKKEKTDCIKIPIGFYLCFSNIIVIILINWLACRR